ncbi:folate-binding protein YgfZ [Thiomicrorhabdus sp. Kp2]|uniref:CAF17-like 4Fe-4S cluster assembly/insertion protein YgfZ n=1 Tax=Thiomicrorhabdus sp. Kp2 TaxID=1123518 RepID=UPI00040C3417|nr:folate-binding protein YgfZ [Thiomicrorhabdus sp. Kp2]
MTAQATLSPIWSDFLASQNAQFDETGKICSFGHPELERFLIKNGPVVTSLTDQALIKVTGSEAQTFLQAQLTSDINQVADNKAQFSAYCDPQGQVLANFLVFKYKGDYYLNFDASLRETILKRLTMFVLRSDVQLTEVSNELIQIGFAGEFGDLDIQRRLSTKVKEVFESGMAELEGIEDVLVIKVPGPYHKYALFGPAEQMIQAWKKIRDNSDVTNNYDWKLLNIAAGVPEVTAATSAQFIAQFFNLDKFDAINFKKGCFPGQEIIARVHYRGKVTKRMLRIHLNEDLSLQAGETLTLKDEADKSYKLTVVSANPDILNGTLCLAIATLKSLESAQGNLLTESGKEVAVEPLPYTITDED